jgi:hypothetical protein
VFEGVGAKSAARLRLRLTWRVTMSAFTGSRLGDFGGAMSLCAPYLRSFDVRVRYFIGVYRCFHAVSDVSTSVLSILFISL